MQEPPWMPRTEEEYRQQVAEDAGPQPDEMVRLQMALDATEEEVARLQMARDAAEREIERLRTAIREAGALLDFEANLGDPERAATLHEVVRQLTDALD